RIEVDGERVGADPAAIYLPTVTMNASVSLDGEFVGDGGSFASPLPRNTNRPLLFEIAAGRFSPGKHHVEIRVATEPPGRGSLGPVFVGPAEELVPFARRSHWLRVETIWGLAVVRLALALFTLALWLRRRHETYYGWYAAVTVAFVLADLNQVVVQPPVPAAAWYWSWYVSTGGLAVVTVRLITSFLGEEDRTLEQALWAIGLAGGAMLAVLAATNEAWFHFVGAVVWLPGTFATACIAVARLRPALRRHPDDVEIEIAYGVVVTLIGAVFHDLLVDVGVLNAYSGRYAPYAAPVAILGMGWVLLRRFLGAIRRSEAMVAGLEERVQRKRRELEEAQARIREIDRAQIAYEERERIFREIQEGIGAKLVSTMAKIEESGA
ncbi:MAG: 7TM diverse intracellular signaling domain-containing protein, partial [Candidatus Binatia bacterium]